MLSKNKIKSITALHQKKFRNQENLFIAEGEKVVNDLLNSGWKIQTIVGTKDFIVKNNFNDDIEVIEVSNDDLSKISTLTTAQSVLAIAEMPNQDYEIDYSKGLKLVLDNIKDPGNFGALLRIADWFGINEIICSTDTVDCFNPKVVMASMGSLFRMKIVYDDLSSVLKTNLEKSSLPVYGTLMNGKNIFSEKLIQDAFIVLGNESNGISNEVMNFITNSIHIPSVSISSKGTPDSLNVAVAAGIVCAQFRNQ